MLTKSAGEAGTQRELTPHETARQGRPSKKRQSAWRPARPGLRTHVSNSSRVVLVHNPETPCSTKPSSHQATVTAPNDFPCGASHRRLRYGRSSTCQALTSIIAKIRNKDIPQQLYQDYFDYQFFVDHASMIQIFYSHSFFMAISSAE